MSDEPLSMYKVIAHAREEGKRLERTRLLPLFRRLEEFLHEIECRFPDNPSGHGWEAQQGELLDEVRRELNR